MKAVARACIIGGGLMAASWLVWALLLSDRMPRISRGFIRTLTLPGEADAWPTRNQDLANSCIFVLSVPGLSAPSRSANLPDLSTPEKAIRSFAAALNKADLQKAAAYVVGAKPTADGLAEMWRVSNQTFRRTYIIDKLRITVKGNQAFAQLQVRVQVGAESITRGERLQLRRDKDRWKIVPLATTTNVQSIGFLQDQAHLLAHPEMFVQIFRVARGNARRIVCTNQVKQIALAALKLAQDHQGRFTLEASSFKKALQPYVKADVFRCGEDQTGIVSYNFNSNLVNVALKGITNPAKTVLIYEGTGGQLNFRHKRFRTKQSLAIVAFVDGHVEEINQKQAATLKWEP